MTTWQRSAPSNLTTPTHQRNSRVKDSPSKLTGLPVEETLEFQVEYPQEEEEVAEEGAEEEEEEACLRLYQHNKQPPEETNSLAIRHSYSQEIAQNQKSS